MRGPRQVTHEIRSLTDAERARYVGRRCQVRCAAPITVAVVYRYTSSGGHGETVVTHPRCAAHGAQWAALHGLKGAR